MNPLIILFFVSIFINDILSKESTLSRIYIYLLLIYSIIYFISSKSKYHSETKHILLAVFSQSHDPSIYGKLIIPITNLKKFLATYNHVNNTKITWTVLVSKILGVSLKDTPDSNNAIKCGIMTKRQGIDFTFLVDIDGKNLANKLINDVDKKSLKKLQSELVQSSSNIRQNKDNDFNKKVKLIQSIPSFFTSFICEIVGFFSNLGCRIPSLGVEPNAFGSLIISSIGGSLGIEDGFAPLLSFSYTMGIATICSCREKTKINRDGKEEVEEVITLNFNLDHRYMDGVLISKVIQRIKEYCKNPELLMESEN